MATLSSNDLNKVWKQVLSDFSGVRTFVPFGKNKFRAALVVIDEQMAIAEADIIAAIPPGEARDWILANQRKGRDLIQRIAKMRQEVL